MGLNRRGRVLDARHIWLAAAIDVVCTFQPGGVVHPLGSFGPILAMMNALSCEEPAVTTTDAYY